MAHLWVCFYDLSHLIFRHIFLSVFHMSISLIVLWTLCVKELWRLRWHLLPASFSSNRGWPQCTQGLTQTWDAALVTWSTFTLSRPSGVTFPNLCLRVWWISNVSSFMKVLSFKSFDPCYLAFHPRQVQNLENVFSRWLTHLSQALPSSRTLSPKHPKTMRVFCLPFWVSLQSPHCPRTQQPPHKKTGAPPVSNPSSQFHMSAKNSAGFSFLENITSSWTKLHP